MKVIFLEDNYFAAKTKTFLEQNGYEVYHAKDISEARELIDSGEKFDAAIFDLDMDKRYLPPELRAETGEAGWIYYKHVLSRIEPLGKNAVIFSAILDQYKKATPKDEYNHLILVNKNDTDRLEQLKNALEIIRGRLRIS